MEYNVTSLDAVTFTCVLCNLIIKACLSNKKNKTNTTMFIIKLALCLSERTVFAENISFLFNVLLESHTKNPYEYHISKLNYNAYTRCFQKS